MGTTELIANSINRLELTGALGASHVVGAYLFDALRREDSALIEIMNACHNSALTAWVEVDELQDVLEAWAS